MSPVLCDDNHKCTNCSICNSCHGENKNRFSKKKGFNSLLLTPFVCSLPFDIKAHNDEQKVVLYIGKRAIK